MPSINSSIKSLMRKYNWTNEEELLKEIMKDGDPQDLINFRVLFTGPYIKTIHAQALTEMRVENTLNGFMYVDKFIDECPSPVDCMSVEETAQVHVQWRWEQNIDVGDYLMKLYCIMAKTFTKVNCLMFQGQSNAGKTFWTLPCMPFPDVIGHTIQSQDFAFQCCLNKEVIQATGAKSLQA